MEIKGKYTSADIYASTFEDGVIEQVYSIINCKAFDGKRVVCMPDCHVGAGGPCGLVAEIGDYICPQQIGVDIGCSVSMMVLNKRIPVDKYAEFEHRIKKSVPMGFDVHDHTVIDQKDFRKFLGNWFSRYKAMQPEILDNLPVDVTEDWITSVLKRIGMNEAMFWHSIGSCGGGNHFCELDSDGTTDVITLHFGSRNFGLKVCEYWTNVANGAKKLTKDEAKAIVAAVKKEYIEAHGKMDSGFKSFKEEALKKAVDSSGKITGYLDGDNMNGYLCDMVFAQGYARYNHITVQGIIADILMKYGITVVKEIHTTHNYIDFRDFTLRKSAISANEGEVVIIPFNMRDGIALCEGLGNAEWLNSAPHGAGRKMSRAKAKETLSMVEFSETMKGIYSTTVCEGTIDESPMAYKDSDEIVSQIDGTTVKILNLYKPLINIKAVEKKRPWEK